MKNRGYLEKIYRKVTRTGENSDFFQEGQKNECDGLALRKDSGTENKCIYCFVGSAAFIRDQH